MVLFLSRNWINLFVLKFRSNLETRRRIFDTLDSDSQSKEYGLYLFTLQVHRPNQIDYSLLRKPCNSPWFSVKERLTREREFEHDTHTHKHDAHSNFGNPFFKSTH